MSSTDFKVVVVGAGSCGLALAQGLKNAGISYVLFERDSAEDYHHRPRDWGSLMHWGTDYLKKCLPADMWNRRSEMYVDPWNDYSTAPAYFNAKTGELIKRIDAPPFVRISRRELRVLLSPGLNIQYSKKVLEVVSDGNKVTLSFQDGSTKSGDLIIGCDGGRSKIREYVVGPDAAQGFDTDYTMINTSVTYNSKQALALRAIHPIIFQAFHPETEVGCLIATLDIPAQDAPPETWKFQVFTGWFGAPTKADFKEPDDAMRYFKERFSDFGEPFHAAGFDIPDGHVLPVDAGWNFKPLGDFKGDNHGGTVTLAGDAAHSMLPHRGQGLNNALMDAAEIVDAVQSIVEGKSPSHAIASHEEEMRVRGTEEVDRTRETAEMARSPKTLKYSPMMTTGLHRVQNPVAS